MKSLWGRAPKPRISVVVPLYNHAAYIGEAVASILAQGPVVQDIVVIDDGSTDESAAAMEALARTDPRIRFTRQPNAGAHATLNTALARCDGELLAILNSDDAYAPDRLTALAAVLDGDRRVDIAATGIGFMDGAGAVAANPWYDDARAFHAAGADLGVALLNGNFLMTTSNLLFRRAALGIVGPFAALRYVHDLDWLLRALALGRQIALLDKPLLRYRIHPGNTIAEDHAGVRAEWAIAAAAYLTTLWDRPGAPPVDWDHAAAAALVLRQHQLDRAVAPVMAYLRRHAAAPLNRSPLLTDSAFLDRVKAWV